MATKQTDTVAMTEQQLDAVAGGIILNNYGNRGSGRERLGVERLVNYQNQLTQNGNATERLVVGACVLAGAMTIRRKR